MWCRHPVRSNRYNNMLIFIQFEYLPGPCCPGILFVAKPAKSGNFTHLCGCKPAETGICLHSQQRIGLVPFQPKLKKITRMKAVIQHTMLSLFCLAAIVLAAPHQYLLPQTPTEPCCKNSTVAMQECSKPPATTAQVHDSAGFLYW